MNTNFDRVATETLQSHSSEIFDNITTNNALLYILKKKKNVKEVSGGKSFTHPLYYLINTSFKSYPKLGVIDTPIMDDKTRAEFPVKIVAGSLVMSTVEEAQNAGDKEKLLDYADDIKLAAELSMSEVLGDQVWASGSVADDFDGLQFLISDSPSTQTDVGGINPSTYSYWRNQVTTASVTAFNTSQEGISALNTLLNNCTFGRRGPKTVLTTKAIYGLYEIGLASQIRYTNTELADAGFLNLQYAAMPVMFDDNAPASHLYMIDTDSLWLQVLKQANMKVTAFEQTHNQLSKTALMYLVGNLTTGSRRTSGVITTITG